MRVCGSLIFNVSVAVTVGGECYCQYECEVNVGVSVNVGASVRMSITFSLIVSVSATQ